MSGIVVVGTGQAGFQLGTSLRQAGYVGTVTLLGEEDGLPYGRPALSKAYMSGKTDAIGLQLRPSTFYDEQNLRIRTGDRVVAILPERRQVTLGSGETLVYEHLVLATGSRNRSLRIRGAGLSGVHQLRTIQEADALKAALDHVRSVVIVGAGFIGLEFAAVCAARGVEVTVLEGAERVLARSVSPAMAFAIQANHVAAGVRFFFGATAEAIEGDDKATGVSTADGQFHPADLVLVGIGVVPNKELAEAAGLSVSDGIDVDEFLATSDPAISAIGDCASYPCPHAQGARLRIESVQNAVDGARCVAARLTGLPIPHGAVPWFWSDQGSYKLQIAGLTAFHDQAVVRGAAGAGPFSVFCYRERRLIGVESLNRPGDHMVARRLLEVRASPTPEQAADLAFDMKTMGLRARN